MKLDWFIARRYLASRRGGRLLSFITWIALGGVTVGVWALVVVIGVMTGMQEDLRDKILTANPHLLVLQTGSALRMDDWREVKDSVMAFPGVVGAAPFVLSQVTIRKGEYPVAGQLYGVSTDTTGTAPTALEAEILGGLHDLETPESGLPPLLLGTGLADRMTLFAGDTVLLISFENLATDAFGNPVPKLERFEVTGTFRTGMYDYDTRNMYTRLEVAQDFLGLDPGVVGGIGARLEDAGSAEAAARGLRERLGFGYFVESWIESNQALFSALKLEKIAMFLILLLIVVVAAFNIVSTLVMVVADRTREIGILKSMGMTDGSILRVFVFQGAWIGVVGTTLGTLLGVLSCWVLDTFRIIRIPPEVYFVDRLPVRLQVGDVVVIVLASLAVAFLATIYPSRQAARLEPVKAIRHD